MKNKVLNFERINSNFIIENGFTQPGDQGLFGSEHVELVGANLDMFDLLVMAKLFTSKSEARNNWKKTGKDIPWGWTHIDDIGKAHSEIAILRPIPMCKKWIIDCNDENTEMVFVVLHNSEKTIIWDVIKNGNDLDAILKKDNGEEVVVSLASLEMKS